MLNHLPDLVDPVRLVDKKRDFQGVMKIGQMVRIKDLVLNGENNVAVKLSFRKEDGINALFGSIETELLLECQRCLKSLVLPVSHDFQLGMISSLDEVELLPDTFEPLLVDDKAIRVKELIEDELLLVLPMVARHDQCDAGSRNRSVEEKPVEKKKDNPFSVLTQLKK
ncbi:MAG: YceD family protein [Methylococcales bacterium]